MDESEEGEICRVCRCEATESEPLFYPCKCSGSIKYVHQSCLSQWLAHSRKNYCELCKHPFSFTPIYSETMPEAIPLHVFLHRGTLSLARGILFVSRCIVIALFWLIVLPYTVLSTFRVMVNLTDKGAKILSYGFQPEGINYLLDSSDASDHYQLYLQYLESFQTRTGPAAETFSSWNDFWSDCFKGQVITVGIVSVFLILFLLREWAFHAFPQLNTGAPLPGENQQDRLPPEAPAVPIPPLRSSAHLRNTPLIIAPIRFDSDDHRRAIRQRILRSRQADPGSSQNSLARSSSRDAGTDSLLQSTNTTQTKNQLTKTLEEINGKYDLDISSDILQQIPTHEDPISEDRSNSVTDIANGLSSVSSNQVSEIIPGSSIQAETTNHTGFSTFLQNSETDVHISDSFLNQSSASNTYPVANPETGSLLSATDVSLLSQDLKDEESEHFRLPSEGSQLKSLSQNELFSDLNTENLESRSSLDFPKELDEQRELIKKISDSLKFEDQGSSADHLLSNQSEELASNSLGRHLPSESMDFNEPITSSSQQIPNSPRQKDDRAEALANAALDELISGLRSKNLDSPTGTLSHHNEPSLDSSFNSFPQSGDLNAPQTVDIHDIPAQDVIHDVTSQENEVVPNETVIEQEVAQMEPVEDQPAPVVIEEEEAADAEDAEDFLEDFNGVAEFLGIRGDPLVLVQYSLMIFIMVTAGLWGFIGLPYLIGRFVMLLEFTTTIKLPLISFRYLLRGIRLVTDPCTHFVIHNIIAKFFGPSEVTGVQTTMSHLNSLLDNVILKFTEFPTLFSEMISSSSNDASTMIGPQYSWGWALYDHFDGLRLITATSDRASDRIITVMVGYFLIGAGYVACVKLGDITSPELISVRRIIYVMTKIAVFILLEILVFPFLCGVLLDYVTLPLFNKASVESRMALFAHAPMSIIFMHWFFGTVFFFLFSMFMTLCRKASRRGLLWFIRDPNEANPQPVREIISRSVKDQVYRLTVSALVYAIIICGGVGAVVHSGRLLPGNVLPLRLHFGRAFHEVSFDLFFIELLIPVLINHFKPHLRFKEISVLVWRKVASWFRLSSFLTGQRIISEEYSGLARTWSAVFRINRPLSHPDYIFIADGGFRRTPNSDTVTIVPGRRMVVPCRRDGRPIDPIDIPSDSPIYNNANISVVYVPPNFALRIVAFIFTIAAICNMIGWTLLFVPLITGRFLTTTFFPGQTKISDVYSYNIGLFLNGFIAFVIFKSIREFKEAKTFVSSGEFAIYVSRIHQKAFKILKQVYIISGVWIFTPFLMALLIDMYLLTPFQSSESTSILKSSFRVSYMWTVGASLLLIARRHSDRYPDGILNRNIPQQLRQLNLSDPQPLAFSRDFLMPFIAMSTLLYAGPLLAAFYGSARLLLPSQVILQWYSRVCLSLITMGALAKYGDRYVRRWRRSIRDEEYLIGQALNNIRQQPTTETN